MPLNISFDINSDEIGRVTIKRQSEGVADNIEQRYDVIYRGSKGSKTLTVMHRPAEGAMMLSAKAMEALDFQNWKIT